MTILNRKQWLGLPILAAVALVFGAAAVGGIEWAFASLGVMVLMGMIGIVIYVLAKALRCSDTAVKVRCPTCGAPSATSFNGDDLKYVTYSKLAVAVPISEQDKRLIMKHVDEFFAKGLGQSREKPAIAIPISERDKRLIMEHVDEFFAKGLGQSEGRLS